MKTEWHAADCILQLQVYEVTQRQNWPAGHLCLCPMPDLGAERSGFHHNFHSRKAAKLSKFLTCQPGQHGIHDPKPLITLGCAPSYVPVRSVRL